MLVNVILKDNIKVSVQINSIIESKIAVYESKNWALQSKQFSENSESSAVRAEEAYQSTLDEVQNVIDTGDTQVQRVIDEGNSQVGAVQSEGAVQISAVSNEGTTQVNNVESEGDTQVQRVTAAGDEAYVESRNAEAEALTADSYATESENVHVKAYYYDSATDSILYNETNEYSALHWSIKAAYAAAGLTYRGVWDSVDCSMPPDDTVTGALYIVRSVSGDSSSCQDLSVGDWLIWSEADDGGTDSWNVIGWTFDWSSITNVPEHIQNAVSRSGDTMSGELTLPTMVLEGTYPRIDFKETDSTDGNVVRVTNTSDAFEIQRRLPNGDWDRNFIKGSMLLADAIPLLEWKNAQLHLQNGELLVNDKVRCGVAPTSDDDLTRKDYVDNNFLSKSGGSISGDLTIESNDIFFIHDGNIHIRFNNSDGTPRGLVFSDYSNGNMVMRRYNTPTEHKSIVIESSGNLAVSGGVAPTGSNHLTTKEYVDAGDASAKDYADNLVNDRTPIRSWIDETSNRELNTVYTNNTGHEIMLAINWEQIGNGDLELLIDDVSFGIIGQYGIAVGQITSIAVPDGSTYELNQVNGANELRKWMELK